MPGAQPPSLNATPKRAAIPLLPDPPPPMRARPSVAASPPWFSIVVSCTASMTGRPGHRLLVGIRDILHADPRVGQEPAGRPLLRLAGEDHGQRRAGARTTPRPSSPDDRGRAGRRACCVRTPSAPMSDLPLPREAARRRSPAAARAREPPAIPPKAASRTPGAASPCPPPAPSSTSGPPCGS